MVPVKILVVLTNFGYISSLNRTPELAHPYEVLSTKAELVFASPNGGLSPVDPLSILAYSNDTVSTSFLANHSGSFNNTLPLHTFLEKVSPFSAIFYPGGHGPMFDLPSNSASIQLIQEFYATEKIAAAVCHGPAVFTNAFIGSKPLVAGKHVTGFSNAEEEIGNMTLTVPFLLEDALKERYGVYSKGVAPWDEHVVVDERLITGQNPNSARGVAEAIVDALGI